MAVARRVLSVASMKWLSLAALAACGGGSHHAASPKGEDPRLIPGVTAHWYRSAVQCAQGPFEIELPVDVAKYGQDIELQLKTPRKVALHAVILDDDHELSSTDTTMDASGHASGAPDNSKCVADARERLAFARAGNGRAGNGRAGNGGPGNGGSSMSTPPPSGTIAPPPTAGTIAPPGATTTAQLVPTDEVVAGNTVVQLRIPDGAHRIRVRLWSVEPNDLEGVLFGVLHIVWHPNVAEADYEAFIHRPPPPPPAPVAPAHVESAPHVEAAVAVHVEPKHVDPQEELRRIEAEHRREEASRRAERDRAIRAEQRRQFCASHPDDRGCWGPGGLKLKLELDAHLGERETYCSAHREDARCWTDEDFTRVRNADSMRVRIAQTPSKPTTPPPAPLADAQPPKLSAHAEWRPGYWQWIESTWVWLAGQWRVPEQDIIAEQTTTAPAAPPAPQAETPPAAPVQAAVWINGFWQWDGGNWVWVPGSWQLRPSATVTWRATTWQPRGTVHILIPGGWVHR
jgi:hypothetical protein